MTINRKNRNNFIFRIAILSGVTIALSFQSCKPEKINLPPEARIEVSPLYGDAPLSVKMKVTGVDPDGPQDISTYYLNVNNNEIKRSYPIDTTITFPNKGNINVYGKVKDSENHTSQTPTKLIEVYEGPFIAQSATLANDIKIDYTATLSKVASAELDINKNGTLFAEKTITDVNSTGADYTKTFDNAIDGITKGNYEFVLKSGNLEKRTSVEVPNYKPTISSIASVSLREETDTTINLPTPTDKNPEDNPVAFESATSLDGKTRLTLLPENKLKIEALPGYLGNYSAKIKFGNSTGGLEETVLTGNIKEDTRIKINPFVQPNDSTLNWYGSGDVTNDNLVNAQDVTRIIELINGTYSNPFDLRLNDRADVNGNGIVNNDDKQLLENKVNGIILYLPGEWNKLTTRAERESWLTKMLAIDEVSEIAPFPGWDCNQYAAQTYINFHGVSNPTDIARFLEIYPYDFSKNGRFNLHLHEVLIANYDLNGELKDGHAMNTIVLGDNFLNWDDLCDIEPQFDQINVQPGQAYLGINSDFFIWGIPTKPKVGKDINLTGYLYYLIKNNIPGEGIPIENPDLKIIYQR